MKKNYILIITLLLLAGFGSCYAQKQTPPEGGQPKDFTLPPKEEGTLQNGLTYTMVPYGAVPKVQINLIVKTGNVHEAADQVWLSDFAGNLMKEGTTKTKGKDLSVKAARMGGELNISVSSNFTTISGSVLSEFAPDLVRLLAEVVQYPAFPASEADRLKNDLKRQLNVQSNRPQAMASAKFFAIMYPEHPYGRYFPTEEMIDNFTTEQARQFYDTNFGAQRSNLYVVGKFKQKAVEEAIQESFRDWKKGPEVLYPEAKQQTGKELVIIDRPGAPQSTLIMGLPVIDPSHPDYVPLQITNALLGGSFSSRITSNIREDKGYTYSPYSTVNTGKGVGVWYEQADVTTEHTQASIREITNEIQGLQQEAPAKEELEGIQTYQAGIYVLQNSTPGGIIGQLNFLDFHELPDSYLTDYVKNVYAISPEKVKEITEKYINPDKMTMVLVGDKKQIEQQLDEKQLKKL